MKTLIIVESAAKCEKISSYAGKDYICMASLGHVNTLKGLGDEIPLHEMFPVGAFGILESTIDKVYNDAEKDAETIELKRVKQLADKQKEISSRESNNETTA